MSDIITRATHPTPCSRCPARRELEAELARARARIEELEAEADGLEEDARYEMSRAEAAEARCASIRAETVAEIVAAVRKAEDNIVGEVNVPWAAAFIEREFPAPVQADTEETSG